VTPREWDGGLESLSPSSSHPHSHQHHHHRHTHHAHNALPARRPLHSRREDKTRTTWTPAAHRDRAAAADDDGAP
jgi:hypothetical protein